MGNRAEWAQALRLGRGGAAGACKYPLSELQPGHGSARSSISAPPSSELDALSYKLRRGCVFTSDDHSTGYIEHKGQRINFAVGDSALTVTQTTEELAPRSVARMRPLVEIEKRKRAELRAQNTERHRRWER